MKIELPDAVFDAQFREDDFRARLRELAIIELVAKKRIHEHEAIEILGCDRAALIEKMRAAGVRPTEEEFAAIRGKLQSAIDAKKSRSSNK